MDLLFPSGGAGLLDLMSGSSSFGDLADAGHHRTPASPETLERLLASLWQGEIEYLIVEEGPVYVQIAGDGDGPYMLQYCPGDDVPMWQVEPGVDGTTACNVVRRVVAGDPAWAAGIEWVPLDLGRRAKRTRRRER